MTDYKDRVSGCATDIDWSKAPEGATHYMPETESSHAVWVMVSGNTRLAWLASGDSRWEIDRSLEEDREYLIPRPAAQWNGEGLPPAGCECEYFAKSENRWIPVVMIGTFRGELVLGCEETGVTGQLDSSEYQLRPRRTPAQIAAEAREAAIQAIEQATGLRARDGSRAVALSIYEAGYRLTKGDDQ